MLGLPLVRQRVRALTGLLALTAPGLAAAQSKAALTLTSTAGAASYQNYAVGPLTGTVSFTGANGLPGQAQAVTLFCVDFLHEARVGETYTANVSAISASPGALKLTRQANGLDGYRRAVWLADQFALQPQANWGAIQGAIWKIFGSGSFDANPVRTAGGSAVATDVTNEAYWTAQASSFAASAQYATYDYGRYAIYSDAWGGKGGRQEFIGRGPSVAVVPEPGTLSLMAVGVVAGAGWAVRRRRDA